MAAKTPTATGEGLLDQNKIRAGALASTEVYSVAGRILHVGSNKPTGTLDGDYDDRYADGTGAIVCNSVGIYKAYFADIDDADTWNTGLHGVFLALWQPDDVDADFVLPYVKNGTGELRKGIIEFQCDAGTGTEGYSGWVWVLFDKSLNPGVETVHIGD